MLNKKIVNLLNEQINKELFSAYLYLDIANYYLTENLNGFGNWFNIQAMEENDHANLFMQYLLNNGEKVVLAQINAPNTSYSDFAKPLADAFAHEEYVTASINNIYSEALEQKDYRTLQFLDWFIKEQGEEEKNADELIKKFELFGSDGKGLFMLDAELATRVHTPPSLVL